MLNGGAAATAAAAAGASVARLARPAAPALPHPSPGGRRPGEPTGQHVCRQATGTQASGAVAGAGQQQHARAVGRAERAPSLSSEKADVPCGPLALRLARHAAARAAASALRLATAAIAAPWRTSGASRRIENGSERLTCADGGDEDGMCICMSRRVRKVCHTVQGEVVTRVPCVHKLRPRCV